MITSHIEVSPKIDNNKKRTQKTNSSHYAVQVIPKAAKDNCGSRLSMLRIEMADDVTRTDDGLAQLLVLADVSAQTALHAALDVRALHVLRGETLE